MKKLRMKQLKSTKWTICFILSAILLSALLSYNSLAKQNESTPVYGYKIINIYPHDRDAFTQGLVFIDGKLYESTGLKGRSELRELDIKTGNVIMSYKLASKYFGEGIAAVNTKIVQLTWRSQTGFVYNTSDLKPIGRFNYKGEGWGITFDGKHLIISNGTATLRFLDPHTYETVGELQVYDKNGDVGKLNELEYVEGEIFANIWGKERIARIDPKTGSVTGWIELPGLLTREDRKKRVDVLNGIAYDSDNKKLYVTGKLWPKLFEIEVVPKIPGN